MSNLPMDFFSKKKTNREIFFWNSSTKRGRSFWKISIFMSISWKKNNETSSENLNFWIDLLFLKFMDEISMKFYKKKHKKLYSFKNIHVFNEDANNLELFTRNFAKYVAIFDSIFVFWSCEFLCACLCLCLCLSALSCHFF